MTVTEKIQQLEERINLLIELNNINNKKLDAMKDETAQQCLSAKLGYVFPNEQELYEDELVRRGL